MQRANALYAQSGGVTAVINATASAVIQTVRLHPGQIGKLLAARNGITGVLTEDLIDTTHESDEAVMGLQDTPGGAFGSCRYKFSPEKNPAACRRLIDVFSAHDIRYFFYNGGGDSQETAARIARLSETMGYSITCIGIPKTIDNDLPVTDCSPGFGSAARYVAISIREAGMDVASMAATSTKVFILEVMGRHSGWLAAAGGLAADREGEAPHIILFPEIPFQPGDFLQKVQQAVETQGYCALVVSEGLRNQAGEFVSAAGLTDAFGHTQLGGVAPVIAQLIHNRLGYRNHWAVADYLQRSARHIASKTDLEQAVAVGKKAVALALAGKNAWMPVIVRDSDQPYRWHVGETSLENVASREIGLPRDYITADGFGITEKCRTRLLPLIAGDAPPPYENGLPVYIRLKNIAVEKKLPEPFLLDVI